MTAITLDTIRAGALRENGHANFGAGGFGYPLQHTMIPRLSAMDRYYGGKAATEAGTSSARLWYVDGAEVASLDEAVERLAVPPVLTAKEAEVLAHVPPVWAELHTFRTCLGVALGRPVGATLIGLRQKGAVETELRRKEGQSVPFVRLAPKPAAGVA